MRVQLHSQRSHKRVYASYLVYPVCSKHSYASVFASTQGSSLALVGLSYGSGSV